MKHREHCEHYNAGTCFESKWPVRKNGRRVAAYIECCTIKPDSEVCENYQDRRNLLVQLWHKLRGK